MASPLPIAGSKNYVWLPTAHREGASLPSGEHVVPPMKQAFFKMVAHPLGSVKERRINYEGLH